MNSHNIYTLIQRFSNASKLREKSLIHYMRYGSPKIADLVVGDY